eukprot:GHUV01014143.1.p1 GENE.GHUV01014143.1~~GHUV01014143.1.p1  ORF type:complete len:285 (+),score=97.25 GHUV01014143.1:124-978(+)
MYTVVLCISRLNPLLPPGWRRSPAGTTTTTESLYMGVPVITLQGNCHAHNVSCSLLAAVGLADQWVAKTPEEYIQLAISHANNITALQNLRQRLRLQMLESRMCDSQGFVSDLEDIYYQLWDRWVSEGGRQRPIRGLAQQQQQRVVQQQQQPVMSLQQQQQHLRQGCRRPEPQGCIEGQSSAAAAATALGGAALAADTTACFSDSSSRPSSCDQHCCSNKGSSSSSRSLGADVTNVPAAATGRLAAAAVDGGGGGVHKGRRLSCSCDAAATVHAGSVRDAAVDS